MQLNGRQLQQLHQALLKAFPTRSSLEQMVRFGLDEDLNAIAGGDNLSDIAFSLIRWAQARDKLTNLIQAARDANPGNAELRAFVAQLSAEVPADAPAAASQPTNDDGAIAAPRSVEVFFSYAHEDEALRDQLATHLSQLQREGSITAWYDRDITAGSDWAGEIDAHLKSAQVILLLVSASFLASRYCYDKEMRQAMQRREAGEAIVIPVILRPCDWRTTPFGSLQALPKGARPVTLWNNQDEAFLNIVQGIRAAIARFK